MAKKRKIPKSTPPVTVSVAVLDAEGVLVSCEHGIDEARARPGPRRVVCPGGCDLEPGRYAWRDGSFWPLAPAGSPERDMTAGTVRAFALGFAGLRDQGIPLHPDLVEWLDWFALSVDAGTPPAGDDT